MGQIDLAAFADYALDTFDRDADFEDGQFAVWFEGVRVYVERKRSSFTIHVGAIRHSLPR